MCYIRMNVFGEGKGASVNKKDIYLEKSEKSGSEETIGNVSLDLMAA